MLELEVGNDLKGVLSGKVVLNYWISFGDQALRDLLQIMRL